MNVKFKIRGLEELEAFLKKLPSGGVQVALKAFVEYVLGNTSRGLRHDEPQKYVSRKGAGYKTSAAQMRFFFATGILERAGRGIKLNRYKRSGETAAAWTAVAVNNWNYKVVNPKAGAYWTRDDGGQSRQHAMAGRRTTSKIIADNTKGGIRSAVASLNKWIRENIKKNA